jgi:hypothetical protein
MTSALFVQKYKTFFFKIFVQLQICSTMRGLHNKMQNRFIIKQLYNPCTITHMDCQSLSLVRVCVLYSFLDID